MYDLCNLPGVSLTWFVAVDNPGSTPLASGQLLTEGHYLDLLNRYGNIFSIIDVDLPPAPNDDPFEPHGPETA